MDMTYLLWLQEWRNSIHPAWTSVLEFISLFSITYLVLVPAFIYWCVNKRKGLFIVAALNVTLALNVLVKLTACVYRPWIKNPHILPAGNSVKTALGYSFPSGHTAIATSIYGGVAVVYRQHKWLIWLCALAILLTGFSRNYLGVHTPQDVLGGLLVGVFSLWITDRLFAYAQKYPERENKLLAGGIVFVLLSIFYFSHKSYPVDYVNGNILVTPESMINNGYSNVGGLLAFCIARFVEKRWIKFSPTGINLKGISFCVIGLVPLLWLIKFLPGLAVGWFGPHAGRLIGQGIWVFYIVAFYPFVLKCFCVKNENV